MIQRAIYEGMRSGFESALTSICDGRDDPDSRCPMRPKDGCACYYRAYQSASWWRRWRMEKPVRPSQNCVLSTLVRQKLDDVATAPTDRL